MPAPRKMSSFDELESLAGTYLIPALNLAEGDLVDQNKLIELSLLLAWLKTNLPVKLNNYTATTDPGAGDDVLDGYSIGSEWVNTALGRIWKCHVATAASAVWERTDDDAVLNNFTATTDPGVGDDSGDGYAVGSKWVNVTLDKVFECLDASVGAAVWNQTNGGAGTTDHGMLSGLSDDDHTIYLRTNGARAGTGIQEFLGINFTDPTELAIVSGAVTVTQTLHTIAAQTGSTDDLDTINVGAGIGSMIVISAKTGHTITLKHGTGNVLLFDATDTTITPTSLALGIKMGSNWLVIKNNTGGSSLPVSDAGALVHKDGEVSKGLTLDATEISADTVRRIQSPDGNSRVRDTLCFTVLGVNDAWGDAAEYYLTIIPAGFNVERFFVSCLDALGALENASAIINQNNVAATGTISLGSAVNFGDGKHGTGVTTAALVVGDLLTVEVVSTGAGSAGAPVHGMVVHLVGYWTLVAEV